MTKIDLTLDLEDPHAFVAQIRRTSPKWSWAASSTPSAAALRLLADAVEAQVKQEEPLGFGTIVRVANGMMVVRIGAAMRTPWRSGYDAWDWEDLDNPQLYRVGLTPADDPLSDGAGALPTSPSPEVGVAASPPASSPDIEEPTETFSVVKARDLLETDTGLFWTRIQGAWWDDQRHAMRGWRNLEVIEVLRIGVGADALRSVLLEKITALQDRAITGVEKHQLGLALDAVRAEL